MATFAYRRLTGREIRLVELDAATNEADPLACRIKHAAFEDERLDFQALSYVWGDPSVTEELLVDGRALRITANLAAALRRLRTDSEQGYLWADAISINQLDNDEKSQQVQMMRDIYSAAERVVVWLGPEQQSDDEAFAQLSRLKEWGHGALHLPIFYTMLAPFGSDDEFTKAQLAAANPDNPLWDGIDAIFQRRWFYRVWIIQEFTCAKRCVFYLGSRELDWEIDFMSAAISLESTAKIRALKHNTAASSILTSFSNAQELSHLKEKHDDGGLGTLYDVLCETYGFEATNPLDRVYAVLGLVSEPDQRSSLSVDYSQSYEALLLRVARTILLPSNGEVGPGLDILSHVTAVQARRAGLPSWVPEWTFTAGYYQPLCAAYQSERPCSGSGFWVDSENVCNHPQQDGTHS